MNRRAGLALAIAVTAFALFTTYVGSQSGAPLEFLVTDLATGMAFIVAGLAAVWLRPASPAGSMLMISGALWFVGSYSPTLQPVVMYIGYAFERYYDLVLAALLLILSSPVQRLQPRILIWLLGGTMLVRSFGRLLLSDPARSYGLEGYPPNVFAISIDPAIFEPVEAASSFAIAGLLAIVGVVALVRLVRAGPVLRRARWPILLAGGVAMAAAAFDAFEYGWSTLTGEFPLEVPEPWAFLFDWGLFGARVLVPLGFLLATLRLRSAPGPLGPFAAGLERPSAGGTVGEALRTALGDPSLVLLRPSGPGGWVGEDGASVDLPGSGQGRAVTFVGHDDRPAAALVHDAALADQPELVQGVVRVLRLALENERLELELREQLNAVTESRERIVSAAEDERRRLERDLHDGAQQRLVGLTLALQQARGTADAEAVPEALREQLDAAARETTEAIRELRELARGIHPAILEDEGLGAAVAALSRRAGIPVDVRVQLDGRAPRLVESTAYFTIAEALTNTQRHAGATRATVSVTRADGALEVEVTDDGQGGAAPERGSGLRGLADRVMAVGGSLDVESQPGAGTRIRATIPLP